ncbi:DUF1289 domain-containing protein [Methyloversatilis discipulorum]|jgi:predicted Fe-S protein YdhL (DUF1289 family)|uniref:DUF1289 domain-containing protein n=1 Tax=Methyloversatilis discipulorum TaxID=1119528 RepID=UPI00045EBDC9|nr:DUF1289 domain-containing protein [Methyloversatilis discipulorum]MDY0054892.1 DUF1289 domain-containing protein [Methyloversatilis sp.]
MVASPCTGVCTLDRQLGICVGCLRTRDEIACWGSTTDEVRLQILERILEREAQGHRRVAPAAE